MNTPRLHQQGAATLVIVLLILLIASMMAAHSSRQIVLDQRGVNHQLRAAQALEAAEAGLEWALAMLNHGRIDAQCRSSSDEADPSFRQRYLSTDPSGRITPALSASGAPISARCVADDVPGSVLGWRCQCPSDDSAPPVATPSGAIQPAFRVRFAALPHSQGLVGLAPEKPGVVRIEVVACTRGDLAHCLDFGGAGTAGEGRAQIAANLALAGRPGQPPLAALLAREAVSASGYTAVNRAAEAGFTVQAGGAVHTSATFIGPAGSAGGAATVVDHDTALQALAPSTGPQGADSGDRLLASIFGVPAEPLRQQPATVRLECGSSACTAAVVRAAARLNPGRPIWLSGGLTVEDDGGGALGSALQPLMLVVNGPLHWAPGSELPITGLVVVRSPLWTLQGGGRIVGAAVADGSVAGHAGITFIHDRPVLERLRWNSGSFVRVPGSWKDYEP
jgi:hypothetical protein